MQKYKSYLRSKTIWAVIFTFAIGLYTAFAPVYRWNTQWVEGVVILLGSVGLYGIRTATTTLGNAPEVDNIVPGSPDSGLTDRDARMIAADAARRAATEAAQATANLKEKGGN